MPPGGALAALSGGNGEQSAIKTCLGQAVQNPFCIEGGHIAVADQRQTNCLGQHMTDVLAALIQQTAPYEDVVFTARQGHSEGFHSFTLLCKVVAEKKQFTVSSAALHTSPDHPHLPKGCDQIQGRNRASKRHSCRDQRL